MRPLSFTLIQPYLHWENIDANLEQFTQLITTHAKPGQVVVLPEMFATGFTMQPQLFAQPMQGSIVEWMRATAAQHKIILTGSVAVEDGGRFYNRAIWMQPDGKFGYYDKRHLFAFADEHSHYTAGNKRFVTSVNGWKIALQVCYDLRFPVWSRQQMDATKSFEYDVLIYVANWPQKRSLAWKSLLVARAIENQCYVIGVNRVGKDGNGHAHNGDSMVIDALGAVLYNKADEADVHTITLEKEGLENIRQQFPFGRDADAFDIRL